MPFKSEKQRRYLWAKHPDIAERWEAEAKRHAASYSKKRRSLQSLRKKGGY